MQEFEPQDLVLSYNSSGRVDSDVAHFRLN